MRLMYNQLMRLDETYEFCLEFHNVSTTIVEDIEFNWEQSQVLQVTQIAANVMPSIKRLHQNAETCFIITKISKLFCNKEIFCKKPALKSLVKFTGKHLFCSLFFNKVAGLRRFGCLFRLGYDCGLFESHMLQTRKLLGIQLKRKFSELSLHTVDTNL